MSIGKIRPGEKIIVMQVSEPLQEHWKRLEKIRDELVWMMDEIMKLKKMNVEIPQEKWSDFFKKKTDGDLGRLEFWRDVNEQYNLWHEPNIGLRDGYCLVIGKKKPDPKEFYDKLRKFVKDELGDDVEIGGGRIDIDPFDPDSWPESD